MSIDETEAYIIELEQKAHQAIKERDDLERQLQIKREGHLAFSFRHYALAHVRKMDEMLYNQSCEIGLAKAQQEQVGYQDYVNKIEQERDELRAQVATLAKSDVEKLPKVNPAAQDLIGTTITELDGTGWLAAETPIGRIGNYASLTALFMAMVYEYQKREERAAQYVRGLEAALEPFARMAEGKEEWRANDVCGRFPTVVEVRAARQALAAKEDRG